MPHKNEKVETMARATGLAVRCDPRSCKQARAEYHHAATPLGVVDIRQPEEIATLIAWAKKEKIPLLPVSSTGEHRRGSTAAQSPVLIVKLDALDKVVRVDRRNRVVLFQPGVTFAHLTATCARKGLRPMLPLFPRPGKSALAAYLEREPTIMPMYQWDMADPLLCLDVVFGTGETFRTGSSAGPGDLQEQWDAGIAQKNPMGPGQSDLMRVVQGAQGSIGMVRWISAKCEPIPAHETLLIVGCDRLDPLVDLACFMLRRKHPAICSLLHIDALQAAAATYGLALPLPSQTWNLIYSIADVRYHPKQKRAYVEEEILQKVHEAGARMLTLDEAASEKWLHKILTPDSEISWKTHAGTGCSELFCQTTMDRSSALFHEAQNQLSTADWAPSKAIFYLQPQLGGRACHAEMTLLWQGEPEQKQANELRLSIAKAWRKKGAFFSRPYGPELTELAFGGSSSAWIVPKVKRLFDPEQILAPDNLVIPATEGEIHAA